MLVLPDYGDLFLVIYVAAGEIKSRQIGGERLFLLGTGLARLLHANHDLLVVLQRQLAALFEGIWPRSGSRLLRGGGKSRCQRAERSDISADSSHKRIVERYVTAPVTFYKGFYFINAKLRQLFV